MTAEWVEELDRYVRTAYRRYARTAYLLTGDRQAAEDLTQSALLKVARQAARGVDFEQLDVYVYRTMVNTRTSGWRRRWRGEVPTADLPDVAAPVGPAVEDRDLMLGLLRQLSARQRAALVLRYYDDLPEAAIAEALGCAPGTVKSLTSRGLARLQALYLADGQATLPGKGDRPC